MKKFELVFIPASPYGHLAPTAEMANTLLTRDHRLSITMLIYKLPWDTKLADYIQSLSAKFAGKSIHFIFLPEPPLLQDAKKSLLLNVVHFIESYKPCVREAVAKIVNSHTGPNSPQLVGFVVDIFCCTMADVAKEFGVPCYVFYTSSAAYLAMNFDLQKLHRRNNSSNKAAEQLDAELVLPSFVNPIPSKVFPRTFSDYEIAAWFLDNDKRVRSDIKGILVNTFVEMEPHVMNWWSSGSSLQVPPFYFVGPILHLKNNIGGAGSSGSLDCADILKWLDNQPVSSVVFLCFGSMGSFDKSQVEEIACGLERSGARFVWSLRRPPSKGKFDDVPSHYDGDGVKDTLPKGFLDRTASIGKVIGWAPQVEILAHPATRGFVSHCGWNSILESVWLGVPIATWPIAFDQPLNAFEMVVELGLAVEIAMDYQTEYQRIVSAEEIENGIRKLMEDSDGIRKKVKAKSEESRKSVMEGGSSFISLGHFIDDVLATNSTEGH